MPKMKTNRGAAKRFRRTSTGRYKCRRAFRSHILTKKGQKRKRQLRPQGMIHPSDAKSVRRMINE